MPDQPTSRSQVLDHLGLIAGMFDELGIGDVIDQATHQNPAMRDLTVGEAVKAMVLNGLGFVNHALYLVPRFFHNKPTSRLIAPRVSSTQLNDDALGRALDTLYNAGVTELYSLIAATAAKRLELCPTSAHLDTTSFHVDGRYNSDDEPAEHVVHITQGSRRDHRPDLKKPERIMALLMVMTVCLLVYAALAYRIRNALKEHGATFPDQKGQRTQNPTARWVFHYFVGIHLLLLPDLRQWPLVLNLTEEHQHLLQLLGDQYAWFYR